MAEAPANGDAEVRIDLVKHICEITNIAAKEPSELPLISHELTRNLHELIVVRASKLPPLMSRWALAVLSTTALVHCKTPRNPASALDSGQHQLPEPTPDVHTAAPSPPPVRTYAPLFAPVGANLMTQFTLPVTASSTLPGSGTVLSHLTDGNLRTAWNSQTGDLVGAWFEVTVPSGVSVQSFAMTAGFTDQNRTGDLFTQNHRVAKVNMRYNGEVVGEYALDPENRGLQIFPLTHGPGTYRVTVLQVVAGTRSNWRELCVSEFALYGTVDADAQGHISAQVAQAQAPTDASANAATNGPMRPPTRSAPVTLQPESMITSIADYCRTEMQNTLYRQYCVEDENLSGERACFCGERPSPTENQIYLSGPGQLRRAAGPFRAARVLARNTVPIDPTVCDLFLRTDAGLFPFLGFAQCGRKTSLGADASEDRPSAEVLRMRATDGDAGIPEFVLDWRTVAAHPSNDRFTCEADWSMHCTVDVANVPTCVKTQTTDYNCYPVDADAGVAP